MLIVLYHVGKLQEIVVAPDVNIIGILQKRPDVVLHLSHVG